MSRHAFPEAPAVLRAVLESPKNIIIFALDRDYRYLAFNGNHAAAMRTFWGVDIKVGDRTVDFLDRPDDRERARRNFDRALAGESFTLREDYSLQQRKPCFYENVYSPIFGETGPPGDANAASDEKKRSEIIGLTVYVTDITGQHLADLELEQYRSHLEDLVARRTRELETANAQLLRAQKLESLGVLAGGVAHDFNNFLAVILGRAELAFPALPEGHPVRSHLGIIRDTAQEARTLTRQLVAYAGKGQVIIQPVDLGDMVHRMEALLRASTRPPVTLELELSAKPLVVQIDVAQGQQAVMNLVSNAVDAIEANHPAGASRAGKVVLRTRKIVLDQQVMRDACIQATILPGKYACIEVEDTGCGMTDTIRPRIFDPFFTTKSAGHGLGLAAVLGIVRSHHGTILLRTVPGQGTIFGVVLPLALDGDADTVPPEGSGVT